MVRFIEFIGNHIVLSALWICLFTTLIFYLKSKSGKAISAQEATLLVNRSDGVFLDIRSAKDYGKGHIVNAVNIPLASLTERLGELEKYRANPVIVICQMGHQSGDAVKILQEAGFPQVSRMFGGMNEWHAQSLPLVTN